MLSVDTAVHVTTRPQPPQNKGHQAYLVSQSVASDQEGDGSGNSAGDAHNGGAGNGPKHNACSVVAVVAAAFALSAMGQPI